jgi:hypothetical protein
MISLPMLEAGGGGNVFGVTVNLLLYERGGAHYFLVTRLNLIRVNLPPLKSEVQATGNGPLDEYGDFPQ